jgi:hypothetical protein
MVKIFKKVLDTATKVLKKEKEIATKLIKGELGRKVSQTKVLASSILGEKKSGIAIEASVKNPVVKGALETVAKNPFTTAAVATGVIGGAKAIGTSTLSSAVKTAATGVIKSPVAAKVATTGAAAVLLNPSLLTSQNLKYAGAIALSPVGAGVGFLTEQAEKTSSYVKSETQSIVSTLKSGGVSSLTTKQKAEIIAAPIVGAALVGGAALAAKSALNSITGGGVSSTKEKTQKVVQDVKDFVQTQPLPAQLPKTPVAELPKPMTAAGVEDLGAAGTSEISAFKQNATVTPEIVKKRHKHRKINKQAYPRIQQQRQDIINQVYVSG